MLRPTLSPERALSSRQVTDNPHFETVPAWKAARALVTFEPLEPRHLEGFQLQSIRIHVRDHRQRELPVGERTLEAHFGAFVLSQSRRGIQEARRLALDVSYGQAPREARIAGHSARVYELGPVPPPDDIDGRAPSVVSWHDAEMFYLIASSELPSARLVHIAESIYPSAHPHTR
jgi:hypothetical protein